MKKNLLHIVIGIFTFLLPMMQSCINDHIASTDSALGQAFTLSLSTTLGTPQLQQPDGQDDNAAATRASQHEIVSLIFKVDNGKRTLTDDKGQPTNTPQKRAELNHEVHIRQHPTMKILTVVRAKNRPEAFYYDLSDWTYNAQDRAYTKETLSIPLSAGLRLSDQLEVRLATGGNITVAEDGSSAQIYMPTSFEREIDLANRGGQEIEMPIPYISNWYDLAYDANTVQMVLAGSGRPKATLNPQGVILLATLRNNMNRNVTLTGVRYVTNAIDFGGTFTLHGNNVDFTPDFTDVTTYTMPITNDHFSRKDLKFAQPLALIHNNTTNRFNFELSKVVVSWAMPRGLEEGNSWESQIGVMSRAQTHVYPIDLQDATTHAPVTKPNYSIVPMMGTTNKLTAGKSYTINCELFEQPNLILGHLAQYPVHYDGKSFDVTRQDDKVSLVNWKVAKEFASPDGVELTNYKGEKAKFKMLNSGWADMLGFCWHQIPFEGEKAALYTTLPNGGKLFATNTWGTKSTVIHNDDGSVSEAVPTQTTTYVPSKHSTVGYRISNKSVKYNENNRMQIRNPDQAVYRVQVEHVESDGGVNYAGHNHYTSVYLGKYFVGNLFTPVYNGLAMSDEAFWQSPIATRNKVERRFPAPGQYQSASLNEDKDVDNPLPSAGKRHHVGGRAIFWFRHATNFPAPITHMMEDLYNGKNRDWTGKQWIDWITAKGGGSMPCMTINAVATNAGFDLSQRPRVLEAFFLPLITYSDTYQGDEVGVETLSRP